LEASSFWVSIALSGNPNPNGSLNQGLFQHQP
jgi:hypothetical protein